MAFDRLQVLPDCWLEASVPCGVGLSMTQSQGMGAGFPQSEGSKGECKQVPKMGLQSFIDLTSEVTSPHSCCIVLVISESLGSAYTWEEELHRL